MMILRMFGSCLMILFFVKLAMADKIYDVTNYKAVGDGKTDDSQAFMNAWKDTCEDSSSPTLQIPSGKNFLIKKIVLQGPCKSSIHVQLDGDITAPNSIWTSEMTRLISFINVTDITVDGSGTIDGQGKIWWDCFNNHKCKDRPYLLDFEGCNNIKVKGLHLKNSPSKHLTFHTCNNVNVEGIMVTSPGDTPNTDGMLVEACKTVIITDCTIGTGDDCIAVGTGSSNVNMSKITCGPGHGISIGSLGEGNSQAAVEQIHVSDCNIFQAQNGVRIKTWEGGSGYAREISFEHINITQVDIPIDIDQFYDAVSSNANAVAISKVTFNDIHGTTSKDVAVNINCSPSVPCRGLSFNNINLSKDGGGNASTKSQNAYGTVSGTIIPSIPLSGP